MDVAVWLIASCVGWLVGFTKVLREERLEERCERITATQQRRLQLRLDTKRA
jgi:hypothetical protein